jgi:thiamine-monophosphate kinase
MTAESAELDRIREWETGRPVGELGEFDLISRLRRKITAGLPAGKGEGGGSPTGSGEGADEILLGVGDDASLLRLLPGWDLVLTCDIQIEGRHFLREWMSPQEAGARAATVNLSDIAAMGGVPVAALVSLGLPADVPVAAVDAIYDGLIGTLAGCGATIAGGNVTAAEQLILDVTLIGRAEDGSALRRSGARAGETVFVTGSPGGSAAALAALRAGDEIWERLAEARRRDEQTGPRAMELRERFRRFYAVPCARVAVGRHLLENQLAGAVVDQSDGVIGDLEHICEESGVGIVIEEAFLPADRDLAHLAGLAGVDRLAWMLGPSDDYELLFTVPCEKVDGVFAMAQVLGVAVTPIGEVVADPRRVLLLRRDGRKEEVSGGWDHLARDREPRVGDGGRRR